MTPSNSLFGFCSIHYRWVSDSDMHFWRVRGWGEPFTEGSGHEIWTHVHLSRTLGWRSARCFLVVLQCLQSTSVSISPTRVYIARAGQSVHQGLRPTCRLALHPHPMRGVHQFWGLGEQSPSFPELGVWPLFCVLGIVCRSRCHKLGIFRLKFTKFNLN